jgi:hypothetical protein
MEEEKNFMNKEFMKREIIWQQKSRELGFQNTRPDRADIGSPKAFSLYSMYT